MLGQRINNFEIVRLLGEGGMGAVYEAEHTLIRRRVAVKVLKPERAVDAELVERFFNEARATSAIRHPNIVEVIDVGTLADGGPYLVMELLEGESLAERLNRFGPLDIDTAVGLVQQAASALMAAHDAGIVHRDLKPENLFLVPDERFAERELVKVLDFGIAKLRADMTSLQTMPGAVIGTPPYMSPEQCRGVPDELDERTDIYALGIILYEALCGAPPFVSKGVGEIMLQHMTIEPEPPSTYRENLPRRLERVILKALAKRREDRFSSMAEFHDALVRYEDYASMSAFAATTVDPIALTTSRPAPSKDPATHAFAHAPTQTASLQTVVSRAALAWRTRVALAWHTRAALTPRGRGAKWAVAAAVIVSIALMVWPHAAPTPSASSRRFSAARTQLSHGLDDATPKKPGAAAAPSRHRAPVAELTMQPTAALAHEAQTKQPTAVTASALSRASSSVRPNPPTKKVRAAAGGGPNTPLTAATKKQAQAPAASSPAVSAANSAPAPGYLSLDSSPWSDVFLGATNLGTTPIMRVPLPPGKHLLTLKNSELGTSTSYVVDIQSGKTISRLVGWEK